MIRFDWLVWLLYFQNNLRYKTSEKKIYSYNWSNWIAKEFREPENQTYKLPFNARQILKVNVKYGDRFCILVILAVMQVFFVWQKTYKLQITNIANIPIFPLHLILTLLLKVLIIVYINTVQNENPVMIIA